MLNILRSKSVPQPVALSPLELTAKEAEEFMALLKKIEDERLWNLPLHIAIGDYMLRTGVSYDELMRRYEAICPEYQKKKFPLYDGLNIAGEWIEARRQRLCSQIYVKASAGEVFDPKSVIQKMYAGQPFPG